MMIRAPDIDQNVKAARKLIPMISDVGGEISGVAVFTNNHAIFFIAVRRRFKQKRPFIGVNESLLLQRSKKIGHAVFLIQFFFAEILIADDAEIFQVLLDFFQNQAAGDTVKIGNRFVFIGGEIFVPVRFDNTGGD